MGDAQLLEWGKGFSPALAATAPYDLGVASPEMA